MRRFAAVALALLVAASFAVADPRTPRAPNFFEGKIVRIFEPEQMLELKVECVEKADEDVSSGRMVFVLVQHARIFENGEELERQHRRLWYTKDEGWARLRLGGTLGVEYRDVLERPLPKELPEKARAGGMIRVLHAMEAHIEKER